MKSLRQKFARALRKWADLIDPRTPPARPTAMLINVEVDTSQAEAAFARLDAQARKLREVMDAARGIRP